MHYLIDGHNLIPHIPGLHLGLIDDEERLVKYLQGYCQRKGVQVDVYFDNAPPGWARKRRFGSVTAHFVAQGLTADDMIRRRIVSAGRTARNWTVVSSDQRILVAAKESHARVMRSEAFARQMLQYTSKRTTRDEKTHDVALEDHEVQTWLEIFEGNDLEKKG
ncbi:MAG: NYN domain-containing protein [Anaerolineales bacterium]|nr:NYN domain-containing protein [Anaerolineales bacterium]